MEVRRLILLLLGGLLVLGGCRTSQHVALLEQELRMQEDRIYQLQDCLQETQMNLDACAQENEALRRGMSEGQGGSGSPMGRRAADDAPASSDLKVEIPSTGGTRSALPEMLRGGGASGGASSDSPMPDMELRVSPGVESPPAGGTEPSQPSMSPSSPGALPPEEVQTPQALDLLDPPPRQEGPSISVTGDSAQAARIDVGDLAIERVAGATSASGEEGFSLLVVPRDSRGASLQVASPISVVVVDPALSGPAARVARWDFTEEQVAGARESSESGDGFRLRLRWPGGRGPAHKELHVFVRYETADGRKLNAEAPFDLGRLAVAQPQLTARPVAGWQRKAIGAARQQWEAGMAACAANGPGAPVSGPAWRLAAAGGAASEAPAWDGPPAEIPSVGPSPRRVPQRVSHRLRAPEWSPERR